MKDKNDLSVDGVFASGEGMVMIVIFLVLSE